jgi:hypothetical protein
VPVPLNYRRRDERAGARGDRRPAVVVARRARRAARPPAGVCRRGIRAMCRKSYPYGTLLRIADTGITRIDFMKCMYTSICNCNYISTSYYRVLVQELRVFRPQNAPNSVPCNLAANSVKHVRVGRNSALAGSSHCTESHGGTRRHTLPTRAIPDAPQASAVLRRVGPEFRVILHGMTRVTQF